MRSLRFAARIQGVWSLADQGSVSLGAFLSSLLLARTLVPSEYGVYVLIINLALFMNNVASAVVTYPLSIRGAVIDAAGLRELTFEALCVEGILLVPVAAIIIG